MNRLIKMSGFLYAVIFVFTAAVAFAAEKVVYYHTDPAGTPLAMTDSQGNVVWKADYRPFGEEQSVTGITDNNRTFVGKEKDLESGLSYFGARYLNSSTGRFIAPDPVGPVDPRTGKENSLILHNPQRQNQYAYGLNNPYRFVDVDGRTPAHLLLAIVGAGASAFGYNMFSPSTANTPGVGEPTIASQTTGEFLLDVAMMETGGRAIVAGGKAIVSRALGQTLRAGEKNYHIGEHALQRMSERGISADQMQTVMNTAKPFKYFHNNEWKVGYYDAESKLFVGTVGDKVTTVMRTKQQYIENLIANTP